LLADSTGRDVSESDDTPKRGMNVSLSPGDAGCVAALNDGDIFSRGKYSSLLGEQLRSLSLYFELSSDPAQTRARYAH